MARADLLKQLFESYQKADDENFRTIAAEIIDEERKKHHIVLANELQRIMNNGVRFPTGHAFERFQSNKAQFDPVPTDNDRRTPLISIRTPDRYLDDLVLSESIRSLIERLMWEFRSWEILEANGLAPVRRVLFCGPSGCGKSATAEAIAAEIGLPLLYVRFDSVVSSLLGETAANLRKVFDYAERGQWVLFFDEFDAIGRSRDDVTEHGEIKRVVNSFLQLLDNWRGRSLVIAATNFEQVLDPAIWRRFDEIVRFERPDASALEALIKKRLVPLQAQKQQIDNLVTTLAGTTFADAERVCLDIRKSSALNGNKCVRDEDTAEALERFRYRCRVLTKATPSDNSPSVDKE